MNTTTKIILAIVIVAVAGVAIYFEVSHLFPPAPVPVLPVTVATSTPVVQPQVTTALYSCDGGKSITAAFSENASSTAATSTSPDQPPVPNGIVALTLSDGRAMTLNQTISADGGRYANADESFVFWDKGNTALVLENNKPSSFTGCIVVAPEPTGIALPEIYSNSIFGFSIRLPYGYATGTPYKYQELGPGKSISGIKFTIASSTHAGTNLGSDSYVGVEQIPKAPICTAALFLEKGITATIVNEGDMQYSLATSTGAGAGNRYEETVYAYPGTSPCIAVRYFIHYGVIENYPAGAVKEFDKQALLTEFDGIRHTLTVAQ
ncbi:MAG: MliC family protein [Minisyncoccia bacterium]